MASKVIDMPGIGPVTFQKTSRSRSIRLSVSNRGVRVSLPRWTPYMAAMLFVQQHTDWIRQELAKQTPISLMQGDKIGKLHTLQFEQIPERSERRSRVTSTKLIIQHHPSEILSSPPVQARAEKAALRALKKEASVVLPARLKTLAEKNGIVPGKITVKQLKRRWGSCDTNKNIVLNVFLMQLSWQQIDYVICHELSHTRHMNHGAAFWEEVEHMLPDARIIAKRVRHIQPALVPRHSTDVFED